MATDMTSEDGDESRRFQALAKRWHNETDLLSSPSRITSHPAYLEIIGMGRIVIPLILRDLEELGGNWYAALEALTGATPVPSDARGDVRRMNEAWFRWARMEATVPASPSAVDGEVRGEPP